MNINLRILIGLLLLVFITACDRNVVFEKNLKIPSETWHQDSILKLSTEISDTIQLYDIYLNLRHSTQYGYRNFYLFFETIMPDGNIVRDTLECLLADRTGKWHGSGFGRIKTNSFLFRESVWFPQEGIYHFRMEQAMREETLEGIIDVGLRIERK